ncbi:MAG: LLM class flavin-dependent oxidoreductase [Dehalococcoidia bacterium]|nr:LLM class flavin-dependent oxidoreductase [Dehalococcoidia bacterium]
MKFALFYEIPVARPWDRESEHRAYKNTLEQAVLADGLGFHSFWTVEHHFLEEFSHCSNPEVLYGAVAARTKNLRIGYGVRLLPQPYNHPVRTAESVAVLDLLSDGRVEFGTGRSSTRLEIEGFGIHPNDTRAMWRESLDHIVGCWTNDEYEFEGKYWSMPKRRVLPKPLQDPHPPIWAATNSVDGHRLVGELGLGLCSFSVGTPPEELKKRIDVYREGIAGCTEPVGKFINNQAASFSMVHCAETRQEAIDTARESFETYPRLGGKYVGALAEWVKELEDDAGTYNYLGGTRRAMEGEERRGHTIEELRAANACVVGDPEDVYQACKAYEATGCDILFCLVNPYNIPHEQTMKAVELIGKHVIPRFS